MGYWFFLAIVASITVNSVVYSEWLRWTKEHQKCTLFLDPTNPSSTTITPYCEDMPYIEYFKKFLPKDWKPGQSLPITHNSGAPVPDNQAISETMTEKGAYHTHIAVAVMNLYSDLQDNKRPMILADLKYNHPYLQEIPAIFDDIATAKQQKASSKEGTDISSLYTTSIAVDTTFKPTTDHVIVHPITFSIPEENIVENIPPKSKSFGRVIPGITSTYYHLYNETLYFEDLKRSMYTITYKKGGWDCLRHYEILAAGSIPFFVHIKHCQPQAISLHPKKLYSLIFHQPGLTLKAVRTGQMTMRFDELFLDLTKVDQQLYSALTMAMIHYTKNVFSTTAMAKHVLDTMFQYSHGHIKSPMPKSIFYLTHQDRDMDKGDYLTDFVLHGLKKLVGMKAVTDFPTRDGLYKTLKDFNETNYLLSRSKLYGGGFSWAMKLDHLEIGLERNYDEIKHNIIQHKYDIVILGSGHRDGWAAKLHFWDLVCKHYHPLEVGYIDGADYHLRKRALDKYTPCAGHLFSREGYVPA